MHPRLLPAFLLLVSLGFTQQTESWTTEEIAAANTAGNCTFMDSTERDIVKYCNLARLYPKKFARLEVQDYMGSVEQPDQYKNSQNKRSLILDLNASRACGAYQPDSSLTKMAECFQLELEASGKTGARSQELLRRLSRRKLFVRKINCERHCTAIAH